MMNLSLPDRVIQSFRTPPVLNGIRLWLPIQWRVLMFFMISVEFFKSSLSWIHFVTYLEELPLVDYECMYFCPSACHQRNNPTQTVETIQMLQMRVCSEVKRAKQETKSSSWFRNQSEDVDHDAGVAVNRGSEGTVEIIKWVESTDTSSAETLKEAVAMTSIWNYEAATPAYELHQIIDAYTLGRQTTDKSGASWVGYDGYEGTNYTDAIAGGATEGEALEYSYKLDAGTLDNSIDSIVQEIDTIKFNYL